MKWLWVVVGFVTVWYGELLLLPSGVTLGRDAMSVYYPATVFHQEMLRAGQWPVWNPFVCGGSIPWVGTSVADWAYPFNWLYLILPAAPAMNWTVFLHLLLAGVAMFLFVWRVSGSGFGGCVAGTVYALGSYFLHRLVSGHLIEIIAAAWLPIVLLCAWEAMRQARRGWAAACGAALGLQFLGGGPQSWLYTVAGLGAAMLLASDVVPLETRGRRLRWTAGAFGLTVLAAAGVAAIGFLPMFLAATGSSRVSQPGWSEYAAFAIGGAVRPDGWAALLLPSPQMQSSLYEYLGMAAGVLALCAPALVRGPAVRWCVALGGTGVFFALGGYNPLYALLYFGMPGVAGLRRPRRALVLVCAAVAALAGLGASALAQPNPSNGSSRTTDVVKRLGWGVAGLALTHLAGVAVMAVVSRFTRLPDVQWRDLLWPVSAPVAGAWLVAAGVAAIVLLRVSRRLSARLTMGLLALVLLADYGWHLDRRAVEYQTVRDYFRDSSVVAAMRQAREPGRLLVTGDSPWFRLNQGMVDRVESVIGAQPLVPDRYARYLMRIAGSTQAARSVEALPWQRLDSPMVNVLGVTHVLSDRPVPPAFELLEARDSWRLYRNPHALPRALVVFRAEEVHSLEQALDRLDGPAFDARASVLLTGVPGGGTGGGQAKIVSSGNHALSVQTSAPGWLVLFEPSAQGWSARVDGQQVRVLQADGIFRAIALPAGSHEVTWVYRPWMLMWGASISLACLGLMASLLAGRWVRWLSMETAR